MLCSNKCIHQVDKKRKVNKRSYHEPVLMEFSTQLQHDKERNDEVWLCKENEPVFRVGGDFFHLRSTPFCLFSHAKKRNLYSGLVVISFNFSQSILSSFSCSHHY
ncbi:hypothetical protein JHK86_016398 [Glycine max]|nr:hypothetical protein JHK86_016398 [Glycine max]